MTILTKIVILQKNMSNTMRIICFSTFPFLLLRNLFQHCQCGAGPGNIKFLKPDSCTNVVRGSRSRQVNQFCGSTRSSYLRRNGLGINMYCQWGSKKSVMLPSTSFSNLQSLSFEFICLWLL